MNYKTQLLKQNLSDYITYWLYLLKVNKFWWSFMKRKIIEDIMIKENINYFIESWTYLWETVNYFKSKVKNITSIELSEELANFSQNKYKSHNNIKILQWDSWKIINNIAETLSEKSLFFLDWHYSGGFTAKWDSDCPLIQEINGISKSKIKNHVVIIDDYRLIWNDKDYPTLEKLVSLFFTINKNYNHKIDRDLLIFYV